VPYKVKKPFLINTVITLHLTLTCRDTTVVFQHLVTTLTAHALGQGPWHQQHMTHVDSNRANQEKLESNKLNEIRILTCLVDVVQSSGDLRVQPVVDQEFVVLGPGAAVRLLGRVQTIPVFAFLGLIRHRWLKYRTNFKTLSLKDNFDEA